MSEPKNMAEAEKRLGKLKEEYLNHRGTPRGKQIATEIYALQEWIVAHERRK
ncbi:hypothetical protein SEA_LILMARTIN_30 [Streptomyces phage LilMartin]|nr:hypothetical protein SEA_LILMARTIN_30 [Streptomyces phage LilMartin]QNO12455.1 hypothetical protein SEA_MULCHMANSION_30 [Streptomyces phage MulchMansion]UVK61128.1 hypothetical protein SEA_ANGELA_30 [Streptomyces phage Angela]